MQNYLAEFMLEQGRYAEAADLLEKIVQISGPPEGGEQIAPLFFLLRAYTQLGKTPMAKNLLPRLQVAYAPNIDVGALLVKWSQGYIAQAEQRWDQAFNAFRAVITRTINSGRRWHQARATMDLASAYLARGEAEDVDQVCRLLQNSLTIFEEIKADGYVKIVQERLSKIA